MYEYKQDYVKFFRHRNELENYQDFDLIKERTLTDERIISIIEELKEWPCYELKTHKNVEHPLHKLSFIAELGFNRDDPEIGAIVDRVLAGQSDEGPFNVLINIPKHFGGSGEAMMTWVMSDAPVVIYSAIRLNNGINEQIKKAVDSIVNIISENGWHCIASKDLGKFRGPGRVNDPCPYATMFSLKMLGLTEKDEYIKEKQTAIASIFDLWERRKETKPYLFGMGTDFKKLKLPFVWYDVLNMVDTLSLYDDIRQEKYFNEMLDIILEKETAEGFIPESIYLKSKAWDFGQKKVSSEYMNAVVERIKKRVG